MIDKLNSLHHKILNSSFAEEVTEQEIQALVMAKKLLEQPKTDWIPCEERLPECEWGSESEELMFQLKDTGSIEVGYYGEGGRYRDKYFRTYRDYFEGVDASDVIAWQPLPQPYKKEGAE